MRGIGEKILCLTGLLFLFLIANAQSWTLKDTGAGLIINTEDNNKPLKIMRRGSTWDVKELHKNGAMEGKYNGNQLFAAWIMGPETKEFLNSKGKPAWMYKYKITYPDGVIFESDPKEFCSKGYSYFGIKTGDYTEGVWKIEWFIINREKQQSSQVATTVFQTTWGNPGKKDHFEIKSEQP